MNRCVGRRHEGVDEFAFPVARLRIARPTLGLVLVLKQRNCRKKDLLPHEIVFINKKALSMLHRRLQERSGATLNPAIRYD